MKLKIIEFLLLVIPLLAVGYILFELKEFLLGTCLFGLYFIYNKIVRRFMNKNFRYKDFSVKKMLLYITLLIIPLFIASYLFMIVNNLYFGIVIYTLYFLYEKTLIQTLWYNKEFKKLKFNDILYL
ncbi:hypothetical protein [Riemerella anatipestifer]|uniref:hypothetical protein n=1 Tax=Riemerella anatipestifer TaxID=34085 RepID=UPI00129E4F07|nr:hypothetical protein [Riemerella anatipestifer]